MNIDEMKLILVNGSTMEFLSALDCYEIRNIDGFGNNILHYFIKLCSNSSPPTTTKDWMLIIDTLLQADMNLEEKQTSGNGCSPLHLAVLNHLTSIAEYLISIGADTNSTNRRNMPILFTALMSNDLSTNEWFVDILLKSGANPDFVLPEGETVKDLALGISNRNFSKYF